MGGERGLAKKMFEFLALITRTVEARKRSEEVAQLRHCVCVDCRSSLKVQEQSFLPSLRLLIQSGGGGGGDHYCRVNWLVWGTPPPSVIPQTSGGTEKPLEGRGKLRLLEVILAARCTAW